LESGGWCWARTVSKLDEWEQSSVVPLCRRARIRPRKLDHERHCCSDLVLRRDRSSEIQSDAKKKKNSDIVAFSLVRSSRSPTRRPMAAHTFACADQGGRSHWRGRVGLWPEEPTTWNRGGTTHPPEKAALDPARKTANPTVKVATALDPVVTATKRMGGRLGGSGKQGAAPDLARRRSDVDDR
jgi:hypothetical protein